MQCPRCRTDIDVLPDPGGSIVCPGCGARLMTRPTARVGEDTLKTIRPPPPPPPALDTPVAGTPAISWPPADEPPPQTETPLEQVLAELKAIREAQAEVLALLRARPSGIAKGEPDGAGAMEPGFLAPARPRVRTRQRKSLLLIDDDPATREAAVAELEQAQLPARAVADGTAGIQAIAAEKPDVIAIELGIGGSMAAKDVINTIKATMEWVDIPIVLYTRLPVESQKEARTLHGADDLVLKRSGPATLVSHVIAAFRRTA